MAAADYYSTVQKIYIAFYSRPADPVGLTYWADTLNTNGGNLAGMIDSFATSSEATDLYAGLGTNAKINAIYNGLFGRDGDVAGITFYANEIAAGRMTIGSVGINILYGAQAGVDLDAVNAKVDYSTSFTAAIDTADELVGYEGATAASTARTELATVVDSTTLTTATANIDATLTQIVADSSSTTGTTFTLTSGADVINGSSANDTITGAIGTLVSSDEIHGSAGTDTLTVKIDNLTANNTGYSPIIDGVETITLEARNASATFFMTNVSGVTTLNVKGITNFAVADLANSATVNVTEGYSADLTLTLAANTATAQALTVSLNDASGTDVIADGADKLTLNAETTWTHGTALSMSAATALTLSGAGNISLNLVQTGNGGSLGSAGGVVGGATAQASGIGDLTAINASGLAGNLTLTLDSLDANIKGGAGDDTFNMSANLNTNDTIDGGAGNDTLAALPTGGYIRPIISNVETLTLRTNATAVTADFRDVSGANTLNLLLGTAVLVDKASTSLNTINVMSSNLTGADLRVNYGTGAAASDVSLNLGTVGTSYMQTATQSATAMILGLVTMSGNSGSLTIDTNATSNWLVDEVALSEFTAVTLRAASGNLAFDTAVGLGSAQTVTLQADAAKGLSVSGAISAFNVNSMTLDAAGVSASIDVSAVSLGTANTLTINTNSAMTGNLAISANDLVFSTAAATGAMTIDTIAINALGGDVSIGTASFASGATSINTLFDIAMGSTAVAVSISNFSANSIAAASTASEQSLRFEISGTGNFTLSTAVVTTANLTLSVDSRDLASGSNLTINLAKVDDTDTVASATFGAHSGFYRGVDGVDNIEFGLGAMTVDGGLGNDVITMNNTAVSVVQYEGTDGAASAMAGFDTIMGAGSGDIIIFTGLSTAAMTGNVAIQTGTATTASQFGTVAFTAGGFATGTLLTAIDRIAIYTAAGDTIIEVLTTTNSGGATAGEMSAALSANDQFVRVQLSNKDFTAITAAFQINTTATGLSITLL